MSPALNLAVTTTGPAPDDSEAPAQQACTFILITAFLTNPIVSSENDAHASVSPLIVSQMDS